MTYQKSIRYLNIFIDQHDKIFTFYSVIPENGTNKVPKTSFREAW